MTRRRHRSGRRDGAGLVTRDGVLLDAHVAEAQNR
jgi:hypothetical protein